MVPAKITDRFLAYLVDTVPFAVGYFAALKLLVEGLGVWRDELFWAWIPAYLLYQAVGNASGGTLGKRLLGLSVVGTDGSRLPFWRAVVRALGIILSTPFFNLGYLWALFDGHSRTWHDLLAGSRVVEARPRSGGESLANAALSFVLLGLIGAAWFWPLWGTTPADRAAVERAREGLKVLARIEEAYKARHGSYTERLVDLAVSSGDPARFREAMGEIFDPRGLRIAADKDRYYLGGRALDRRRTEVSLAGP